MSKGKDSLCLRLEVIGHDTSDRVDKETKYTVVLKSKIPKSKTGKDETIATMKLISNDPELFDDFPKESERQVTLKDEQTTLA